MIKSHENNIPNINIHNNNIYPNIEDNQINPSAPPYYKSSN